MKEFFIYSRIKNAADNSKKVRCAVHIVLAVLGAAVITALSACSVPVRHGRLDAFRWALLLGVPFIASFLFYMAVSLPAHSVFRSIHWLYILGAPLLPLQLIPAFFDQNNKSIYTDSFYGKFLPAWVILWVIGMAATYLILRVFLYIGRKIAEKETETGSVLRDMAVMFTPQKKLDAQKSKGKGKKALAIFCIVIVALASFLFAIALFLKNVYGNMEFEAIWFTIRYAKGGLAVEDIIQGTEYTLIFLAIAGYICLKPVKCILYDKVTVRDTCAGGRYTLSMTGKKRAMHAVLSLLMLAACCAFFCIQTNFAEYMKQKLGKSYIYETYYVKPDDSVITFPENKRNLIFIFIESMENTYASKEAGGSQDMNYISELTELAAAKDSVNFSNTGLLGGASVFVPAITNTQGSTVAQTTGISLITKLFPIGAAEDYPSFRRLEDVMHDNGYRQIYIEGSKGEFSMYDQYVARYEDSTLYDRVAIVDKGYASEDGDYIWKWGIEDRKLFDVTKKLVTEAASGDKPFFVTMYTMDTHSFESGHRCLLCDESIDNAYLASVDCASRQVAEFVSWVQEQSFYENTTIVLVGDHLGNEKAVGADIADGYVRTTYNCFINPAKEPVNSGNRIFSSLDMFPTTISAIGAQIKGDRLGLGTDLFSGTETLCEKLGEEEYKKQLQQSSDYYDREF